MSPGLLSDYNDESRTKKVVSDLSHQRLQNPLSFLPPQRSVEVYGQENMWREFCLNRCNGVDTRINTPDYGLPRDYRVPQTSLSTIVSIDEEADLWSSSPVKGTSYKRLHSTSELDASSTAMPDNSIYRQKPDAVTSSPGDFELQVIRDETVVGLLGDNAGDEHGEVFHIYRSSEDAGSRSESNSDATDNNSFIASSAVHTVLHNSSVDGNGGDSFVEKSEIVTTTAAATDKRTTKQVNIDNWTLKSHPDWLGLSPRPSLHHEGSPERRAEAEGLTQIPSPAGTIAREIFKEAQKITGLVFKFGQLFRKSDRKQTTNDSDDGSHMDQSSKVKGDRHGSSHGKDEESARILPPHISSADWISNVNDVDHDGDEDIRTLLEPENLGTTNLKASKSSISTEGNIVGTNRVQDVGDGKGQQEQDNLKGLAMSSDRDLQQAAVNGSRTIPIPSKPELKLFKDEKTKDSLEIHGSQQSTTFNNNYDYFIDISGLDSQSVDSNPSLNFDIKSNKTSSSDGSKKRISRMIPSYGCLDMKSAGNSTDNKSDRERNRNSKSNFYEYSSSVSGQTNGDPNSNFTPPRLVKNLVLESIDWELKPSPSHTAQEFKRSEDFRGPLGDELNSSADHHPSPIKTYTKVVKSSAINCFHPDDKLDKIQGEGHRDLPLIYTDLQQSLVVEELKVKLENITPIGIPITVLDNLTAVHLDMMADRGNQNFVQGNFVGECTEDPTWEQTGYFKVPHNSPDVVFDSRNSPNNSIGTGSNSQFSLETNKLDDMPNGMVTSEQRQITSERHVDQSMGGRMESNLNEHKVVVVLEQATRVSQCENLPAIFQYFHDSTNVEDTFADNNRGSNNNNSYDIDDILVANNNNKNNDSKLVDESLDLSVIVERNIPNIINNCSLPQSGKLALDVAGSIAEVDEIVDNNVVEPNASVDDNGPQAGVNISTLSVSNFATSHPAFLEKLVALTTRKLVDVSIPSSQLGHSSQTRVAEHAAFGELGEIGTGKSLLKTINNDNVAPSRRNYTNDNDVNPFNTIDYSGCTDSSSFTFGTTESEYFTRHDKTDSDNVLLYSFVGDTLTSTPVTHKVITYCPVARSPQSFGGQGRNSFKEAESASCGDSDQVTEPCDLDFLPSAERSLGYLKALSTASNELDKNNDAISFTTTTSNNNSSSGHHKFGASSTPLIHSSTSSPLSLKFSFLHHTRPEVREFETHGRQARNEVKICRTSVDCGSFRDTKGCQFRSSEDLKLENLIENETKDTTQRSSKGQSSKPYH